MTVKRTTQVAVEALSQVSPNARATQLVVEVLSANALKMQTTQLVVEVLSSNDDIAPTQGPQMIIIT